MKQQGYALKNKDAAVLMKGGHLTKMKALIYLLKMAWRFTSKRVNTKIPTVQDDSFSRFSGYSSSSFWLATCVEQAKPIYSKR